MIRIDGQDRSLMAWIPARGGSKGVPRKALRLLGGRPLIAHTVAAALSVPGMDLVLVNTDDPEIREAALAAGAEAPFLRPGHMAGDTSDLGQAVEHQWAWLREHRRFVPDIHVGMSPCYPLRRPGLVQRALELAREDARVFNVRALSVSTARTDNFWTLGPEGPEPFGLAEQAAGAPLYQDAFSANVVLDCREHRAGKGPTVLPMSALEAIDIDEPVDLALARLVLELGLFPDAPEAAGQAEGSGDAQERLLLFGRALSRRELERAAGGGVFRHPDFPRLAPDDLEAAAELARRTGRPVVSGRAVAEQAHPYRLLRPDEEPYSAYAAPVPQAIRGHRQSYPPVHSFVPALAAFPPGAGLWSLLEPPGPLLLPLPAERLLDLADPLEALHARLLDQGFSPQDILGDG